MMVTVWRALTGIPLTLWGLWPLAAWLPWRSGFHGAGNEAPMIPGEIITDDGDHALNTGRRARTLGRSEHGRPPIQVGSHYHFAETDGALGFDRALAPGMRLNIASGSAVRFEPGQQRTMELVEFFWRPHRLWLSRINPSLCDGNHRTPRVCGNLRPHGG